MSDYQKLIFELNEQVKSLVESPSMQRHIMETFEKLESDSMDISEFSENLINAVRVAKDSAPNAMPTLLLIASEIAKSRL